MLVPISVRLSEELLARLKSLAGRTPLDSSDLVRMAVEEKIPLWEKEDKITITLKDKPASEDALPQKKLGNTDYKKKL